MKKVSYILPIIISVFYGISCNAQVKGLLTYSLTINDGFSPSMQVVHKNIFFKNNNSIELPVNKKDTTSKKNIHIYEKLAISTISVKQSRSSFIYKNSYDAKLILADNIGMKYYLINDTLSNFKWKIINEFENILGYKCSKATTNFRGRNYVAWFTDKISINNGPWKFNGLPGLILKVYDTESKYVYEIEGIDFNIDFDETIINIPQDYSIEKSILHEDFIKLYKKKVEDLDKEAKASVFIKGNVSGSSRRSIPPKMEKF